MNDVIDLIINGIKWVWQTMENFEFLGTNMLQFSITIMIITAFIPILLTLVRIDRTQVQRSDKVKENDK